MCLHMYEVPPYGNFYIFVLPYIKTYKVVYIIISKYDNIVSIHSPWYEIYILIYYIVPQTTYFHYSRFHLRAYQLKSVEVLFSTSKHHITRNQCEKVTNNHGTLNRTITNIFVWVCVCVDACRRFCLLFSLLPVIQKVCKNLGMEINKK